MPFSINPDLIENNDVEIQTVDGELALFHKPSGNTLIVDEDTTVSEKLQSPLRDNVDLDGNDLISGGSGEFAALEADQTSVEKSLTRIGKSADQIMPDGGTIDVDFDTVLDDSLSAADVDNDAVVIQDAGTYVIRAYVRANGGDGEGRIRARILSNSNELVEEEEYFNSNFIRNSIKTSAIADLDAGDEVRYQITTASPALGEITLDGGSDRDVLEVTKVA